MVQNFSFLEYGNCRELTHAPGGGGGGGVLDISLDGEVRRGRSYPEPV